VREADDLNRMPIMLKLTEADRQAAVGVTTQRSGHKFEIQLGHLCNDRCNFCSSGQLSAMKVARPVPIASIITALEEARAAGASHLTFLGGEPTIHKRFLEAVAAACDLGFEHIVIFTNGVMFPHPGFIDSVTALGNFEWRISIQGATEEAHVATTGRPDSFRRILHGLRELQRRGQLVTSNMCANEQSYRSMPEYPELLGRYGVRQLHVDIIRPESIGERSETYLREIMPRYSDMAPFYAAMLDGFERRDPSFDINVGNLPYCILPAWGPYIHHGGEPTVTKSSDATSLEDAKNKYQWHASMRTHLPGCVECVFRPSCTGIFSAYLELYGGDEFRPVSYGALRAIDPPRRNIVRLIEPLLAPLRQSLDAGVLPPSWRLLSEISEHRRQAVELRFAHDTGGEATLRWMRPGHGHEPILATSDYDLEAAADPGLPLPAVSALLAWTRDALAIGTSALPVLAADAVDRARRSTAIARGRTRATLLAARLADRLPADWGLDPMQWLAPDRAELTARRADGASVTVVFALGAANGRSQVDVDFRLNEQCDQDTARWIVERFTALRASDRRSTSAV
jgi:MoaA/NifB/PqqE/SkfB family radical SAM enzyme